MLQSSQPKRLEAAAAQQKVDKFVAAAEAAEAQWLHQDAITSLIPASIDIDYTLVSGNQTNGNPPCRTTASYQMSATQIFGLNTLTFLPGSSVDITSTSDAHLAPPPLLPSRLLSA